MKQRVISDSPICQGHLYSIYAIKFVECIANTLVVKEIVLDDIIMDYPFATDDQSSIKMNNKEINFLLYWWFASNIFMTCGKKNHVQLPDC